MFDKRIRFLKAAPWFLIWGAFFAFGLWLNSQWPNGVTRFQVYGYDYSDYMWFLSDWHEIFYPRPRHLMFGVLFFPMAVMCGWLKSVSPLLCFFVINAFFAAVMTASSYLVDRISNGGISAAILYASFASTMLLGGMPESFGISALICLLALKWCGEGKFTGCRFVAMSIVAGGVTVTQGVKMLLMRLAVGDESFKARLRWALIVGLWCAGAALAIGLLFVAVYLLRKWSNPDYSRTLSDMFCGLGVEFSCGDLSWGQRLNRWWVYVSEPILTRGTPFEDNGIPAGYSGIWHLLLIIPMYATAGIGAWLSRRETIVKAIFVCLVVDVGIHFVCGWGIREPHLYAGHWTFAIPIFAFFALKEIKSLRLRQISSGVVAVYGAVIAILNLHAFGVI